jgi:hypothetical protein
MFYEKKNTKNKQNKQTFDHTFQHITNMLLCLRKLYQLYRTLFNIIIMNIFINVY